MIQETEDDRLDQSLRDTFSDFNLPPAGHVWRGIEGRLPTPVPASPQPVPLLVLLPVVGLMGVAVGWLLPRPATLGPAAPQPVLAAPATGRLAERLEPATSNLVVAYTAPRAAPEAVAALPRHTSRPRPVSKPYAAVPGPAWRTVAVSAPTETVVSSGQPTEGERGVAAESQPGQTPPTATAQLVPPPQPEADSAAPVRYPADVLSSLHRPEILRERRPEFRTPTHRLAERGRGLRRVRTAIAKQWQRVFGPRRTRLAAPPSF